MLIRTNVISNDSFVSFGKLKNMFAPDGHDDTNVILDYS